MENKVVKTFRLSPWHLELIDEMVDSLGRQKIKTNKTVVVEKAIYHFAKEILGREAVSDIVDKHLNAMLKNRGE